MTTTDDKKAQDAAELGAIKALTDAGVLKPYLSKAEAYRSMAERKPISS
ncbi:hypothetical protein [Pedobacter sp. B4-66]|nr:hypothetical protein [Pedobacter sp. B4-66]